MQIRNQTLRMVSLYFCQVYRQLLESVKHAYDVPSKSGKRSFSTAVIKYSSVCKEYAARFQLA